MCPRVVCQSISLANASVSRANLNGPHQPELPTINHSPLRLDPPVRPTKSPSNSSAARKVSLSKCRRGKKIDLWPSNLCLTEPKRPEADCQGDGPVLCCRGAYAPTMSDRRATPPASRLADLAIHPVPEAERTQHHRSRELKSSCAFGQFLDGFKSLPGRRMPKAQPSNLVNVDCCVLG